MADEPNEPIERWTAKRRAALVVSLLKRESSVAEAARPHTLTVAEIEDWRDRFLDGTENALRSRPKEAERALEAACLARFGTLRPLAAPILRSDNGLIFPSRRFRQAC